jgi:chromosome segregation ATPase
MMEKKLIIICLVIVLIYLAYQQNNLFLAPASSLGENQEQITKLQNQVQHYQTLYQKRVEKDLNAETLQTEIQGWEQKYNDLEQQIQAVNNSKNILQTKLENQNKINEEAQKQITLLETIINHPKNDAETQTDLSQEQINNLYKQTEYYQKLADEREKMKGSLEHELADLKNQIQKQQTELTEQWAKEKKELVNKLEQTTKNLSQNSLKNSENLKQLSQEHQEQLKKINLLFDDKSESYESIDFNDLYSLLSTIQQRLNKPHQETSTQTETYRLEDFLEWLDKEVERRGDWSKIDFMERKNDLIADKSGGILDLFHIRRWDSSQWMDALELNEPIGINDRGSKALKNWKRIIDQQREPSGSGYWRHKKKKAKEKRNK